jgi:hypothetical protein
VWNVAGNKPAKNELEYAKNKCNQNLKDGGVEKDKEIQGGCPSSGISKGHRNEERT